MPILFAAPSLSVTVSTSGSAIEGQPFSLNCSYNLENMLTTTMTNVEWSNSTSILGKGQVLMLNITKYDNMRVFKCEVEVEIYDWNGTITNSSNISFPVQGIPHILYSLLYASISLYSPSSVYIIWNLS